MCLPHPSHGGLDYILTYTLCCFVSTAVLSIVMQVYWMTEALPLPITSMIPMVGFLIAQSTILLSQFTTGRAAAARPDAYKSGCDELSKFDELHVPWRADYGYCGGALRPAQPCGAQDHHDGRHQPGQTHAGLHVYHYGQYLEVKYFFNVCAATLNMFFVAMSTKCR